MAGAGDGTRAHACTCPACRSTSVHRLYRLSWMRFLVLCRRCSCDDCGCGFIAFCGFFKWRLT